MTILSIDDFAFRRGRDYGTILIDVETGRPVDLLRDREAGTVADWLKEHPRQDGLARFAARGGSRDNKAAARRARIPRRLAPALP